MGYISKILKWVVLFIWGRVAIVKSYVVNKNTYLMAAFTFTFSNALLQFWSAINSTKPAGILSHLLIALQSIGKTFGSSISQFNAGLGSALKAWSTGDTFGFLIGVALALMAASSIIVYYQFAVKSKWWFDRTSASLYDRGLFILIFILLVIHYGDSSQLIKAVNLSGDVIIKFSELANQVPLADLILDKSLPDATEGINQSINASINSTSG